jgi:hypothetical protein
LIDLALARVPACVGIVLAPPPLSAADAAVAFALPIDFAEASVFRRLAVE